MKYESLLEEPQKIGLFAVAQEPDPRSGTNYELRLDNIESMNRVLPLVRAALMETNKNFSIQFEPFAAQISDSIIRPRLVAVVSGFFGVVALILASTGLYGVITYSTARRKAEIGLRMALGASYRNVLWLVLRETGLTLAVGAALGLSTAYFAARLVKSLVFGVQPNAPGPLVAALGALVATAILAAYIPARASGAASIRWSRCASNKESSNVLARGTLAAGAAHLFSKRRGFTDDLGEEMRLHLDLRAAENPGSERETRVRFGNLARIQEESRAAWTWPTLESIVQDVRYGVRTLAASPAFTLAAIVSLTLGIGANTAIFSLLNAIMLRTLPVKNPGQLMGMRFGDLAYLDNPL